MSIIVDCSVPHVAQIKLDRPEKHNALDGPMVHEMISALDNIAHQPDIQLLQIASTSHNFCAGADMGWMKKMAVVTERENEADAHALASLFIRIDAMPIPVMALVQGAVYGGGVGIVAASAIVICSEEAVFGFPETQIGLCPSVVSPWVMAIMGNRRAQYYFLTGEMISSQEALRLGLVHRVVPRAELHATADAVTKKILSASPYAITETRQLVREVARMTSVEQRAEVTANHLARIRRSTDAQEGLAARLEKRRPLWGR